MNRIGYILKLKGIKQSWLCEKLGKSYNTINNYVNNRSQPPIKTLYKIAEILDITTAELIGNNDIKTKDSNVEKKDKLSHFHEKNVSHQERKKLGQFYTHQELVKYILNQIPVNSKSTILDPTVGAGAFLISCLKDSKEIVNNLYGIEIDEVALNLCKENIKRTYKTINLQNFICANVINSELNDLFPKISKEGGFDIIIGNPPYQNLKAKIDYNPDDEDYKKVISGIANSCTLILTKCLKFLKNNGYLGFVLPKNILRVESFSGLRNHLAKECTLLKIIDLGHYFKDVRGDQIIIIIQNKKPNLKNSKIKVGILNRSSTIDSLNYYTIEQNGLCTNSFYPIYRNESIIKVANKLLTITTKLSDYAEVFRGFSIGANNELISKKNIANGYKIYRGDSISKFGIKYSLYFNSDIKKLDETKFKKLNRNKIILQNLCSKEAGITATISKEVELNIDTVTNVVSDKLDNLFLLGILNSNLANFFLLHIVFLSSNFSMHTDKQYIGQIPIKIPNKKTENSIKNIVFELLEINGERTEKYKLLFNQLNKLIYNLYSINKEEELIIEKCLKETLSKKQYYGSENE